MKTLVARIERTMVTRPRKASRPAGIAIQPKPLELQLGEGTPSLWFGRNPFLCHFMTAFFGLFPRGERQMIRIVRRFRDQVSGDRSLSQEVSAFIGQEAHHANAHAVLNDLLTARGVPVDDVDAILRAAIGIVERLPDRQQMALVGAAEHFTALFGRLVLANPEILDEVHPDLRALCIWHSVEELEHKAVTYDLYEAVGGHYAERVAAYTAFSILLFGMIAAGTARLAAADRSLLDARAVAGALWWMLGFGTNAGYFRKNMLGPLIDFFRPGFHPWDQDDSALITRWKPVIAQNRAQTR